MKLLIAALMLTTSSTAFAFPVPPPDYKGTQGHKFKIAPHHIEKDAAKAKLTKSYWHTLAVVSCYKAREGESRQLFTQADVNSAIENTQRAESDFMAKYGKVMLNGMQITKIQVYTTSSQHSSTEIPKVFGLNVANPGPLTEASKDVARGTPWVELFGNKDYKENQTMCTFIKQLS